MKALVTAPFIPIVPRLASHRSSQGVIYADQIRQTEEYEVVDVNWGGNAHENHNDYDVVYVYWGSDWTGGLEESRLSHTLGTFVTSQSSMVRYIHWPLTFQRSM
jgi:hypothetical protein